MRVALVNYGLGNLGSVRRALEDLGADVVIAEKPAMLAGTDRIILPGVGAFKDGMARLHKDGWVDVIHREIEVHGKPLLGICLGMQMLADSGDENGPNPGLGLIPGHVRRLDKLGCDLRIPHVGWNDVNYTRGFELFNNIPQGMDFYFVHSYAFDMVDSDWVTATTHYGVGVVAAVAKGHVFGTQFHPEKSSKAGKQILENFLSYSPCSRFA